MDKTTISKEEIIAEYLAGGISFIKLGKKYNIPGSTVSTWVNKYEGRHRTWRDRMKRQQQLKQERQLQAQIPQLPEDVRQLQSALLKAELHNKLVEEILRLSEEHNANSFNHSEK